MDCGLAQPCLLICGLIPLERQGQVTCCQDLYYCTAMCLPCLKGSLEGEVCEDLSSQVMNLCLKISEWES